MLLGGLTAWLGRQIISAVKKISDLLKLRVSIDNRTVIRVLAITFGFILALAFIWLTRQVWILIIVSAFLAIALNPPVSKLASRLPKRSRALATGLAYVVVVSLIGLLISSIAPPLARQGQQLARELPNQIDQLQTADSGVAKLTRRWGIADDLKLSKDQIVEGVSKARSPFFNAVQGIFSSIAKVLAVFVMTFMMLVEGPKWLESFWTLQPQGKEKHRKELAQRMYGVITSYVNGQLTIAFLLGLFSFLMLSMVHVNYALPLAAIVGLLGLIPLIGNPIGALILVLVGLFHSISAGVILLVAFVLYQQFENYVLHPFIQSRKVEISPLTVFIAAIFGINVAGLLGALLAIPIAACARILLKDYIEVHHLRHEEA